MCIRDSVVIVHHVEMDQVGAGGLDRADLLAEAGEICGQDARCDAEGARHGRVPPVVESDPRSGFVYNRDCSHRPALPPDTALRTPQPPPTVTDKRYQFRIEVQAVYLPEQSKPDDAQYSFAYTVRITNTGNVPAQLISRHWIIRDESGRTNEVKGLGVVGHQPLLKPGERFEYTSGSQIATPAGSMKGSTRSSKASWSRCAATAISRVSGSTS